MRLTSCMVGKVFKKISSGNLGGCDAPSQPFNFYFLPFLVIVSLTLL